MTWHHTYPKAVVHDMHVDDPDHRPTWTQGAPVLIVNHFTVTCGATFPATGRFASEGIGPAFGIRRDGTVLQYVDLDRSTWHARDCSHHGVGIEFDADPGGDRAPGASKCPILVAQLEAGADLNAWLCGTFDIPAVRSPGIAFHPGIKCHTDGLEDDGVAWDKKKHWDAPWKAIGDPIEDWASAGQAATLNTSPWSAARFIERVAEILNPPLPTLPGGIVLTDEDAQQLGYSALGDWKTQEHRSKAIADVMLGLPKRPDQGPAYEAAYDAAEAKLTHRDRGDREQPP